jgi:hypothetical protein
VCRTDEAGLVRIAVNRSKPDVDLFSLEDDRRPADHELAHATCTKPSANCDTLGVFPALQLEIAANDQGKFLGEVLDRAMDNSRRLRFSPLQKLVKLLPTQFIADLIAKRIVACLPKRFAPVMDDLPECAFAGTIAEKALVILELDVVAVEIN